MYLIIPSVQLSGIIPLSKITLNNKAYIANISSSVYLMYSLSILSLPADLPFFNFCTTDFISSGKQYKQTTNKAYNDYQLQLENKLRNTSKYNGKDFWKILNRFAKNKKGDQSNISNLFRYIWRYFSVYFLIVIDNHCIPCLLSVYIVYCNPVNGFCLSRF
jgi:hypothetical protein